jgi:flagellar biogenesis protein FliO
MKPADVSHDWIVALGLGLALIGVANWLVGRQRTRQYDSIVAAQPVAAANDSYRSFDELGGGADAVLKSLTEEQRRVSYASARMDFYHATYMTGYGLVIGGLIVTFLGFLRLIRRDARQATGRAAIRVIGQGPPA